MLVLLLRASDADSGGDDGVMLSEILIRSLDLGLSLLFLGRVVWIWTLTELEICWVCLLGRPC